MRTCARQQTICGKLKMQNIHSSTAANFLWCPPVFYSSNNSLLYNIPLNDDVTASEITPGALPGQMFTVVDSVLLIYRTSRTDSHMLYMKNRSSISWSSAELAKTWAYANN